MERWPKIKMWKYILRKKMLYGIGFVCVPVSYTHLALPQDFVKYGLIPEFVGRVPVSVSLDLLDEDALVRVLTEPKSAIIKQYKKLFQLDGVDPVSYTHLDVYKRQQ